MGQGFFTSYRKNIIAADEILISLFIPRTKKNQHFLALKQAKRRDDDIAIVNGAFNVIFKPNGNVIENINFAFGGMAPTTVMAPKTSAQLVGLEWNRQMVEKANEGLMNELPLSAGAPGGMILYRRSLTLSLFFKAFLSIGSKIENCTTNMGIISDRERSGADVFHTITPKSAQLFEVIIFIILQGMRYNQI